MAPRPRSARQLAGRYEVSTRTTITARHVLLLDYRDRHDVVTVREVEPVAFAGTQTQWYLMAWCRLRDSARAFRVNRILAAVDTGEPAPQAGKLSSPTLGSGSGISCGIRRCRIRRVTHVPGFCVSARVTGPRRIPAQLGRIPAGGRSSSAPGCPRNRFP